MDINLYSGIDGASVRPLAVTQGSKDVPFTAVRFYTEGGVIVWMLDQPSHLAFAARLRDIADAIETGKRVDIDKGYRTAGEWITDGGVTIEDEHFSRGYTVHAADYEYEQERHDCSDGKRPCDSCLEGYVE